MADSIREKIINRFEALIKLPNGAGGYNFNLTGMTVYRNRSIFDLSESEYPVCTIWDTEREERQPADFAGNTLKTLKLSIEVVFIPSEATPHAKQANNLGADMEKALMSDDTALDALEFSRQDTGLTIAAGEMGSTRAGASIDLEVQYITPTGDPYKAIV